MVGWGGFVSRMLGKGRGIGEGMIAKRLIFLCLGIPT